jgi:2-polyprenyl-3-methyl-5-hydroxy-6-metoxy-1,4-benzoquinol methylase
MLSVGTEPAREAQGEISAGNPWYVEDQFRVQLGSAASRAVVENRWSVFARAIDEWSRLHGGAAPSRILDAGCGDGINLMFLSRMRTERQWRTTIVGTDYSSLRVSRARTHDASRLVRACVVELGFRDESFDVVLCNQVLEHVPEDRTGFRELRRVLRPGGLLMIGVPNEGSPLGLLRNHVLQRSILTTTDHVNMYTDRLLRARLEGAGVEVVRIEPEGFFHTTHRPPRLAQSVGPGEAKPE